MEWISVKEKFPEVDAQVIGYLKGYFSPIQMVGYGIPDKTWYYWNEDEDIRHEVTHWMPLPEEPNY